MNHRLLVVALSLALGITTFSCSSGGSGGNQDAGAPPADAAPDSDGDFIPDHVEGTGDEDGDGIPNYLDRDADGDTIDDIHEGSGDFDGDGVPNFLDQDSDQDCISDRLEAGDDDPNTAPRNSDSDNAHDAIDLDSDDDGLFDNLEDLNCDGMQTPVTPVCADPNANPPIIGVCAGETSPIKADTDDDLVPDLIEVADCDACDPLASDPLDPTKNPRVRGDFVFIVPFEEPTLPLEDDLDFSTNLKTVDVYFLLDRSDSIANELADLRSNIISAINNLTCDPQNPTDDCIPNIFTGAGGIGYPGPGGQAFTHLIDVQGSPSALRDALTDQALDEPGCTSNGQLNLSEDPPRPCDEMTYTAMLSALTGQGSDEIKASVTSGAAGSLTCADHAGYDGPRPPAPRPDPDTFVSYPELFVGDAASNFADNGFASRTDCTDGGTGYPCFRRDALPVIMYVTDESSSVTVNCPQSAAIISAANDIGAKIVGVSGTNGQGNLHTEMRAFASGTDAVDIRNNNEPLIVDVDSVNETADLVEDRIRVLANGVPLEIKASTEDDGSDEVDAIAAFIDRLETQQIANSESCSDGLSAIDTDSDTFPDTFQGVTPGTPVCWKLVAKMNTTVAAKPEPQIFRATVQVRGNDITKLDERDVWFLVPPKFVTPIID